MEVLYIIMRSDIESHTNGKKMAQASHASNAFVKEAKSLNVDISNWENSTDQGFGTVLVLESNNFSKTETQIEILKSYGYVADVVFDPTYPLIDGAVVHHIPLNTCAYVYTSDSTDQFLKGILNEYKLHP